MMRPVAPIISRHGLWLALGLALSVRLAVMIALPQPMVSDALAYFHMADGAAHGGPMTDIFGQYAFYSPGYPLLLAGPFALLGSKLVVAESVNLLCAAALIVLIYQLARRITDQPLAPALAALGAALWLPSVLIASMVAKENLSTPLLMAYALGLVMLVDSKRPLLLGALLGLLYGFGLLVGGSVILTALAFGVALRLMPASIRQKLNVAALFALGAMTVLIPWLIYVQHEIGAALLSTNAPFNLYLGNNPIATGWFESIADTPIGPIWHQRSAQLGEAGTAFWLNAEAHAYILAHPLRTLEMCLTKLLYFWLPHGPHVAGERPSHVIVLERLVVDGQYLFVLTLGLLGAWKAKLARPARALILTVITSFWLIHGVTYIIPRYHDPVMPLLIIFAAVWLGQIFERKAAL